MTSNKINIVLDLDNPDDLALASEFYTLKGEQPPARVAPLITPTGDGAGSLGTGDQKLVEIEKLSSNIFGGVFKTTDPMLNQALHDLLQELVTCERYRQVDKFGNQVLTPSQFYVVLGEEFGEVGRAICDGKHVEYVKELLEVAAVALNAIHSYTVTGSYSTIILRSLAAKHSIQDHVYFNATAD